MIWRHKIILGKLFCLIVIRIQSSQVHHKCKVPGFGESLTITFWLREFTDLTVVSISKWKVSTLRIEGPQSWYPRYYRLISWIDNNFFFKINFFANWLAQSANQLAKNSIIGLFKISLKFLNENIKNIYKQINLL